jgi:hypothetical protein
MADDNNISVGVPSAVIPPAADPPRGTPLGGFSAAGRTADWPIKAVDAIDSAVATVNDKAVRPIIVASRTVVFGLIITVMAITVLTLFIIFGVRIGTVYLFDHKVWITYLVYGAIFSIGGFVVYAMRKGSTDPLHVEEAMR